MDDKSRSLVKIKQDLKVVISNKLSIPQSKLLFMGIVYEIILRKDLFPRNENLKEFINNIFVNKFKEKVPFGDYLYKSRTLLAARVLRKIISELEYNQIVKIVHEIYNIIPDEQDDKFRERKSNIKNDDELSEWMHFIRNKGENK